MSEIREAIDRIRATDRDDVPAWVEKECETVLDGLDQMLNHAEEASAALEMIGVCHCSGGGDSGGFRCTYHKGLDHLRLLRESLALLEG